MTQITKETENAINDLVQHFLLDEEKTKEQILAAIEHLATVVQTSQEPFRAMGALTLQAMINKNLAVLQAQRAVLAADFPTRGPLQ